MRNTVKLLLTAVLCLLLMACGREAAGDVWENALYTQDTELGEGEKTVKVLVEAEEKKITFTIHSDEAILGEALKAHGLLEGDEGEFGLYIKKVNGILADYDADQTYWGFYQNGAYMMTGVDSTEFADGEQYELVRTK